MCAHYDATRKWEPEKWSASGSKSKSQRAERKDSRNKLKELEGYLEERPNFGEFLEDGRKE
jgi:trimethylamine:corrinoid methyltransferase-like protein